MNTRSERAPGNGKRSRGPVAAEGKARSANNSTGYGCYAASGQQPPYPLPFKKEDGAAYQELLSRLCRDFLPANSLEYALVRELCAVEWRITRNFSLETQILNGQIAAECDAIRRSQGSLRGIDPIDATAFAIQTLVDNSPILPLCGRELARLQRARRETLNTLLSLRKRR
ncbi:hypothetical protein [uncultured Paludibaculum sp.]|uniref:hypothetical protein n=1 Tax=uncultured Paludibaculum sp. TaxID=1765020 RepID=UPI002AAC485B|nr:hypothetical protein [uncultured Paludibaculum sp.]